METVAVVWFAGGLLAAFLYLVLIARPEYRERAPNRGVVIEAMHYGPRVAMVFALWPVFVVAFVGIWLGERGRK